MDREPIVLAVLRPGALAAFEAAAALAGVRLAVTDGPEAARAWLAIWPRPAGAVVDLDEPGAEAAALDLVLSLARAGVPALAAGGAAPLRRAALARGARDFVTRPFDLEALADRLAMIAARPASLRVVAGDDLASFASCLAHEVLNPLAGALGMTELALLEAISPAARAALEQALDAGRRAAAVVRGLESFATRAVARPAPELPGPLAAALARMGGEGRPA
jgi:signal transduction histidine kinase